MHSENFDSISSFYKLLVLLRSDSEFMDLSASDLEEHSVNNVIVFHIQFIWCLAVPQPIDKSANQEKRNKPVLYSGSAIRIRNENSRFFIKPLPVE
jgi:hypothetical protein